MGPLGGALGSIIAFLGGLLWTQKWLGESKKPRKQKTILKPVASFIFKRVFFTSAH